MINFVLPDFYYNFSIINFLAEMALKPEYFKYPVNFTSASGNFPFALWNGQYNIIQGAKYNGKYFPLQRDYACFKDLSIPIRLNCANICLDDDMFFDEHMNVILSINDNMSNFIEVSNLDLLTYIQTHYKNYRFIFSDNADLIHPFNLDLFNNFTDFEQFYKIKLPTRFNQDFEFLKQIKNKNKVEITVNDFCPFNCPSFADCHIKNDEAQTHFSELNVFENCDIFINKKWNLKNCISLQEIHDTYEPLGFHYFNFTSVGHIELYEKLLFFFFYFFKEEYVFDMLKLFNKKEGLFI